MSDTFPIATSKRQRLMHLARTNDTTYNRLQLLYIQERWLARLAKTQYDKDFVLKGGLLIFANLGLMSRATKDIDFLGLDSSLTLEHMEQLFQDIGSTQIKDGVTFDLNSIKIR